MSISTRPVVTSKRALSDGTWQIREPDLPQTSIEERRAGGGLALTATTCGAANPRTRGSHVITISVRPSGFGNESDPGIDHRVPRRSGRRDTDDGYAVEAMAARHSPEPGAQYPGWCARQHPAAWLSVRSDEIARRSVTVYMTVRLVRLEIVFFRRAIPATIALPSIVRPPVCVESPCSIATDRSRSVLSRSSSAATHGFRV